MVATAMFEEVLDSKDLAHDTLKEIERLAYESEDAWRDLRALSSGFEGLTKMDAAKATKRAFALLLLGRAPLALEELEGGKALASDPVGAWVLGRLHLAVGDAAAALDAFEAGLKKAKDDLPLVLGACEAERLKRDPEAALQRAEAALKKAKGDADARFHLAACKEALGEYDEAMDLYEEILEESPEHPDVLFRLAYCHELRGSQSVAIEYYERLSKRTPTYANGLVNYGLLLEDLGKYDEASALYRRVLAARPDHERARMFLKDSEASVDMYYDEDMEKRSTRRNAILRIPVTDFELSVRARNCLNKMGIRTLGDLVVKTEEELLAYKNFGETSLHEIKQMLAQKSLRLGMFRDEGETVEGLEGEGDAPDGESELLKKPVAELELSVRARNCMERLNIRTVGELVAKSEPELLAVKNFGQTSLNEVKQRLAERNLTLRQP